MKTFSVLYETTTTYEAVVRAKSLKEAQQQVRAVIGDDVTITDTWQIRGTK